jgi:hypothetical protein
MGYGKKCWDSACNINTLQIGWWAISQRAVGDKPEIGVLQATDMFSLRNSDRTPLRCAISQQK